MSTREVAGSKWQIVQKVQERLQENKAKGCKKRAGYIPLLLYS